MLSQIGAMQPVKITKKSASKINMVVRMMADRHEIASG